MMRKGVIIDQGNPMNILTAPEMIRSYVKLSRLGLGLRICPFTEMVVLTRMPKEP